METKPILFIWQTGNGLWSWSYSTYCGWDNLSAEIAQNSAQHHFPSLAFKVRFTKPLLLVDA